MEPAMTGASVAGFALLVLILFNAARQLPLGVLSLPAIMAFTSMVYFYLMPLIAITKGEDSFYGLQLTTLEPIHAAVILYTAGAGLAFLVFSVSLRADPSEHRGNDRKFSFAVFLGLVALAIIGLLTQVALGYINLLHRADYVIDASFGTLSFLTLSYPLMIPLTLVFLIRRNYDFYSLLVLLAVMFVFLTIGFRSRIVILLCGALGSFVLIRNIKLGFFRTVLGVVLMFSFINLIGLARNYYLGVDLSSISGVSFVESIFMFRGEIGPVYTLAHIVSNPPDDLILFDPWIVAISRLVPSFLWYEKPFPDYLLLYPAGFPHSGALGSGVSAPQHAEFLLQFGWIGLPFLAFVYFSIAGYTVKRLQQLGPDARIAGCAIVPTLFGFYMQQRGYFFQFLCEYLFMIVPLFLLYYWPGGAETKGGNSV